MYFTIGGDTIANLKQVFGPSQRSLTDIVSRDLRGTPVAFLFGGFSAWVAAEIPRLIRRTEISEPLECMNYLDYNLSQTASPWRERLWDWLIWGGCLSLELPFEFTSTLQSLGFMVLPAMWSTFKRGTLQQRITAPWLLGEPLTRQLAATTGLYLIRDYLHRQIGWRIYGLLRQVLPRPHRPNKLSIQATDDDDCVDDVSIVGIGRGMGTGTDRRFYGPHSLWAALPVAFPWLSLIIKNHVDKDEIKKETLMRCAMMESSEGMYGSFRGRLIERRAQCIISNLESLGVDVEEDFCVDIDQWTLQIDSLEPEEEVEEVVMPVPTVPGPGQITNREDFLIAAEEYRQSTTEEQQQGGLGQVLEHADTLSNNGTMDHETVAEQRELDGEVPTRAESNPPPTNHIEAPATPEPGIRRATSLSTTTPRPVRRPTETNGADFDDEMEAMLAEARRDRTPRKKVKTKDSRQYRMTRLTTHATDSLAWHSSAIITSLVMLPIDAMYHRSLASWFISVTGYAGVHPVLPMGNWLGGIGGEGPSWWRYYRMLLLSLGVECLVRGAVWQVGCRVALSYGRWFGWGQF